MRHLIVASAITISAVLLSGCAGYRPGTGMDDPDATFSAVHRYPMGPSQWMISCVDSPAYCASAANKSCPQGFDVTSNTTNPADYGRMTMVIKCH